MVPFRTILCPTDFSDCANEAFRLACSLARAHGARLIVVHVNDVLYGAHSYGGVMAEVRPADYLEQLQESLKRLRLSDPGVTVEHMLVKGRAAEEILRVAKERNCDVIVIGTHGRTGLQHLLLGSIAEQVLRHAPCPVLTVRPGVAGPAASAPAAP